MLQAVKKLVRDEADDAAPPAIRPIREVADVGRAEARLIELQHRCSDLDARITSAVSGLGRDPGPGIAERAQALLDSGTVVESTDVRLDRLRGDLASLYDERRVVRRAVELQRQALDGARHAAVSEMKPQLHPYRRALTMRLRAALETLTEIAREDDDYRQALIAAGWPSGVFEPIVGADFLEPLRFDREWSVANIFLKDARRAGLID